MTSSLYRMLYCIQQSANFRFVFIYVIVINRTIQVIRYPCADLCDKKTSISFLTQIKLSIFSLANLSFLYNGCYSSTNLKDEQ